MREFADKFVLFDGYENKPVNDRYLTPLTNSSTKEGATPKMVTKRRNKNKIAKKQRKQNRK